MRFVHTVTECQVIAVTMIPVVFLTTLSIGRWLKRHQGVEFSFTYLLFAGALSLYLPAIYLGPDFLTKEVGVTSSHAVIRHLGAVLSVLSAFVGVALIRRYFWELWFERKQKAAAPKFLSQIVGLIIILATILSVISMAYGKDLTAFLFGSTVVVGIIGFAMQDLLGNIIAGIALEIGKPFKTGDWLIVDTQHAEVIEVNWRSTRLRTNDDIYLDIPNKSIVGATITNLTYPTKQHAIRIRVGFEYRVPPNAIKDCMIRAAERAQGVLTTPAPKAFLYDYGDSAVIYEIKFWLDNEAAYNEICDTIRTNIWYEAQRRNFRIPFPIRTLHIERNQPRREESMENVRAAMRKAPFLHLLNEAQETQLLSHARVLCFGRHETVIKQGEVGESMFILLEGEASVTIGVNGTNRHVATLHEGDYFGEMSLLTGEPRSATVNATVDCKMWEIHKSVLGEILQENEGLVEKLSELLASRRLETEGVAAASLDKPEISARRREYASGILAKLCSFFEI